ncbi:MAG: PEP-CTERM sorting domain-containing protein [Planctomycetes bacterium]|nr:PEP-CTERM sorting domain-containing protein [Planctomycetota bacterium]
MIKTFTFACAIIASVLAVSPAQAVLFNLKTDWSESANPNGPWSLNEGANALPHVDAWQKMIGGWATDQPGWARSEDGSDRLPFWFQSNGNETFGHDWVTGDIVVHATDPANGAGNGLANVTWTAPSAGLIDILGGVYLGRDIDRSVDWRLRLNGTLLTGGSLFSGDLFDSGEPFEFSAGSGGANAVLALAVSAGDVVTLEFERTSVSGDFVVVDLGVELTAVPEPATFSLMTLALAAFRPTRRR